MATGRKVFVRVLCARMLKFNVKFDDKEMFDEIVKQRATLKVGFFPDQVYEAIDKPFYANVAKPNTKGTWNEKVGKPRRYSARKQIPVAQVAMIQEYGDPAHHIPPRPFMKWTVYKNWRKWGRFVQDKLPQLMDAQDTMERLGQIVVQDMKDMITDWSEPSNKPSTIAQKGFNNPLIDSGQMRDTVRMEVV